MNALLRGIKATYNFFAGDAIILGAVALAFALGLFLERVVGAANVLVAVVFVLLIVLGLTLTLSREQRGRPRSR